MQNVIVTHLHPDLDAALGTWLLAKWAKLRGIAVSYRFVPAGQGDATAQYVVDTGGAHDPARGQFDHHFAPLAHDRSVCAATLVADWVSQEPAMAVMVETIRPLIDLVCAGDHGQAPEWSWTLGPHALAEQARIRFRNHDADLLAQLHAQIDLWCDAHIMAREVDQMAAERAQAARNGVWIVEDGSAAVTRRIIERYAPRVVAFWTRSSATTTVGIQRGNEAVDCAQVVARMRALAESLPQSADACAELARWYAHPSGFFAGRGTAKAPDPTPITYPVWAEIVALVEQAVGELYGERR